MALNYSSFNSKEYSTDPIFSIKKGSDEYLVKDAIAAAAIDIIQGNGAGSISKAEADAKSYADEAISTAIGALGGSANQTAADGNGNIAASVTSADGEVASISVDASALKTALQGDATNKANAAQTAAETTAANALSAKVGNLGTIAAKGTEGEADYVAAHDATVKEYVDNAINTLAGEDWTANAGTVKQIIDEIKGDDIAGSMVTLVDKLDTLNGNITIGSQTATTYDVKGYVDAKVADVVASNNSSKESIILNGILTLGL